MKKLQLIFSILTVILAGISAGFTIVKSTWDSVDYLILSLNCLFISIAIAAFITNGQNSKEESSVS